MLGLTLCSSSADASAEGQTPATEVGVAYSFLRIPEYSGWSASFARNFNEYFGWVVDGGGFYSEGDKLHLAMTGPRVSFRGMKRATLFAQVVAGAWLAEGGAGFIALPGAGVDLRPGEPLGFRVQVDWPLVTREGVFTELPRFSAGIVLRPKR